MLVPEFLEVLGGQVEELDVARQRLVQELNKPARGKSWKLRILMPAGEELETPHAPKSTEEFFLDQGLYMSAGICGDQNLPTGLNGEWVG